MSLAQLLLARRILDRAQISAGIAEAERSGTSLLELLQRFRRITPEQARHLDAELDAMEAGGGEGPGPLDPDDVHTAPMRAGAPGPSRGLRPRPEASRPGSHEGDLIATARQPASEDSRRRKTVPVPAPEPRGAGSSAESSGTRRRSTMPLTGEAMSSGAMSPAAISNSGSRPDSASPFGSGAISGSGIGSGAHRGHSGDSGSGTGSGSGIGHPMGSGVGVLPPTGPDAPTALVPLPPGAKRISRSGSGSTGPTILPVDSARASSATSDSGSSPAELPPDQAREEISPFAAGSLSVIDGYRLIQELGQSATGTTHLAERDGVEQVLKLYKLPADDRRARASFDREARALSELESRAGLVDVVAVSSLVGRPWVVYERMPSGSLADELRPGEARPPEEAFRIVGALAEAVAGLHDKGLLHRNIKLSNVLLDENRQPRLTDFGLGRSRGWTPEEAAELPVEDLVWLAPEQLNRDRELDSRVDVHGLGLLLYRLLTGSTAYSGEHAEAVIRDLTAGHYASIGGRSSELPGGTARVLEACLAREPELRYGDAGALAEDCRRLLAGDAPLGDGRSASARALVRLRARVSRAGVGVIVGVALAALVLVGGGVTLAIRKARTSEARSAIIEPAEALRSTIREASETLPQRIAATALRRAGLRLEPPEPGVRDLASRLEVSLEALRRGRVELSERWLGAGVADEVLPLAELARLRDQTRNLKALEAELGRSGTESVPSRVPEDSACSDLLVGLATLRTDDLPALSRAADRLRRRGPVSATALPVEDAEARVAYVDVLDAAFRVGGREWSGAIDALSGITRGPLGRVAAPARSRVREEAVADALVGSSKDWRGLVDELKRIMRERPEDGGPTWGGVRVAIEARAVALAKSGESGDREAIRRLCDRLEDDRERFPELEPSTPVWHRTIAEVSNDLRSTIRGRSQRRRVLLQRITRHTLALLCLEPEARTVAGFGSLVLGPLLRELLGLGATGGEADADRAWRLLRAWTATGRYTSSLDKPVRERLRPAVAQALARDATDPFARFWQAELTPVDSGGAELERRLKRLLETDALSELHKSVVRVKLVELVLARDRRGLRSETAPMPQSRVDELLGLLNPCARMGHPEPDRLASLQGLVLTRGPRSKESRKRSLEFFDLALKRLRERESPTERQELERARAPGCPLAPIAVQEARTRRASYKTWRAFLLNRLGRAGEARASLEQVLSTVPRPPLRTIKEWALAHAIERGLAAGLRVLNSREELRPEERDLLRRNLENAYRRVGPGERDQ